MSGLRLSEGDKLGLAVASVDPEGALVDPPGGDDCGLSVPSFTSDGDRVDDGLEGVAPGGRLEDVGARVVPVLGVGADEEGRPESGLNVGLPGDGGVCAVGDELLGSAAGCRAGLGVPNGDELGFGVANVGPEGILVDPGGSDCGLSVPSFRSDGDRVGNVVGRDVATGADVNVEHAPHFPPRASSNAAVGWFTQIVKPAMHMRIFVASLGQTVSGLLGHDSPR